MPPFNRYPRQARIAQPSPVMDVDDLLAELDERISVAHQTRDPELVDELLGCRYEIQTRQQGGVS